MESKAAPNGEAYDVVANENVALAAETNSQVSTEPASSYNRSDKALVQRLFCIITTVVVVSFLIAATGLVLAVMVMLRNTLPTSNEACAVVHGKLNEEFRFHIFNIRLAKWAVVNVA